MRRIFETFQGNFFTPNRVFQTSSSTWHRSTPTRQGRLWARLAALRANDMDAYSRLLQETKNERLKFLLGKMDECFSQISGLLQTRSTGDESATVFTSTSASSTGSYYASAHSKLEDVRQPSILVGDDLKECVTPLSWTESLPTVRNNGLPLHLWFCDLPSDSVDEDTADDANTDANRSAQLSDEAARKGNGTVGAPLVFWRETTVTCRVIRWTKMSRF